MASSFAVQDRRRQQINVLCRAELPAIELLARLGERLDTAVGCDAVVISATDPDTTLLSSAVVVAGLPPTLCAPWLDNEFVADDFNKFADLHRTGSGATTLHRATYDRPDRSARYRDVNPLANTGPELRATFSLDGGCWGVLNLLRASDADDFTDDDLRFVDSVSAVIAGGLRRAMVMTPGTHDHAVAPGVLLLDGRDRVTSMTDRAVQLLEELGHPPVQLDDSRSLPGEAYVVAARARARALGRPGPEPFARVRSNAGGWFTLRGDCARDAAGGIATTTVVIEPARSSDVLPLFVAAYELTPREQSVLAQIVEGHTTTRMASNLHISPHTVRDHVKSLFEKVAVSSRGELVRQLYGLCYEPGVEVLHRT